MKYPWQTFLRKIAAPRPSPEQDFTQVFAVPNDTAWWLAVHQILDEAEAETVASARNRTGNPHLCIADVGAGEGVDLVRQKLLDKRRLALANIRKEHAG